MVDVSGQGHPSLGHGGRGLRARLPQLALQVVEPGRNRLVFEVGSESRRPRAVLERFVPEAGRSGDSGPGWGCRGPQVVVEASAGVRGVSERSVQIDIFVAPEPLGHGLLCDGSPSVKVRSGERVESQVSPVRSQIRLGQRSSIISFDVVVDGQTVGHRPVVNHIDCSLPVSLEM